MRIVRVFAALALMTALAGCGSSGQLQACRPQLGTGHPAPAARIGRDDEQPRLRLHRDHRQHAGRRCDQSLAVKDALLGGDPGDDLVLGKRHYRAKNYGLAEQHFRRAVEKAPRDGEAWLGLAASYDRLKRYDLADRAYSAGARDLRAAA